MALNRAENVAVDPACEICKKTFSCNNSLRAHMYLHNGNKPYKCKLCDKAYIQLTGLIQHTRRQHTGQKARYTREKTFQCDSCDKCFCDALGLERHESLGHKVLKCTVCGETFLKKRPFNKHMRTHSDFKKVKCTLCQEEFSSDPELNVHKESHKTVTEFKCEPCISYFVSAEVLVAHKENHKQPLACRICGKKFLQQTALQLHKKCHDKNGFTCYICEKTFSKVNKLKKHLKKHVGNEDMKVGRKSAQNGLESETTVLSFLCSICGKADNKECTQCEEALANKPFRQMTDDQNFLGEASMKFGTNDEPQTKEKILNERIGNHENISHESSDIKVSLPAVNDGTSFISQAERVSPLGSNNINANQSGKSLDTMSSEHQQRRDNVDPENYSESFVGNTNASLRVHVPKTSIFKKFDKKHKCTVCARRFRTQLSLMFHKKGHGKNPCKCSFCPRTFVLRETLATHLRVHTSKKPFKCKVCGERFMLSGGLKFHVGEHQRESVPRSVSDEILETVDFDALKMELMSTESIDNYLLDIASIQKSFETVECDVPKIEPMPAEATLDTDVMQKNTFADDGHRQNSNQYIVSETVVEHNSEQPVNHGSHSFHESNSDFCNLILSTQYVGSDETCAKMQLIIQNLEGLQEKFDPEAVNTLAPLAEHQIQTDHKCERVEDHIHCSHTVQEKGNLKVVLTRIDSTKVYACHMCSEMFSSRSHLQGHIDSHSGRTNSSDFQNNKSMTSILCPLDKKLRGRPRKHQMNMSSSQSDIINSDFQNENRTDISRKKQRGKPRKYQEGTSSHLSHSYTGNLNPDSRNNKNSVLSQPGRKELRRRGRRPLKKHFSSSDDLPFSCPECDKVFVKKIHFKYHMDYHEKFRTFTCRICEKKHSSAEELEEHSAEHKNLTQYFCNICDKYLRDDDVRRLHEHTHEAEKACLCTVCGKSYDTASSFRKHLLAHTVYQTKTLKISTVSKEIDEESSDDENEDVRRKGRLTKLLYKDVKSAEDPAKIGRSVETLICPICSKKFSSRDKLKEHAQNVHKNAGVYCCPDCDKIFHNKYHFNNHTDYHDRVRAFTCLVCAKKHSSAEKLEEHSVVHKYQKLYFCEICDKYFRDKTNLRVHSQSHETEKAHCCDICGSSYACQRAYNRHLLAHDLGSYKPPKRVAISHNRTDTSSADDEEEIQVLKSGTKVKISDSVYIDVADCEKFETEEVNSDEEEQPEVSWNKFVQRCLHKQNVEEGSNSSRSMNYQNSFQCPFCRRVFASSDKLREHATDVHKKVGIHSCPDCGKLFSSKVHLSLHTDYHERVRTFTCLICSKKHSSAEELEEHIVVHKMQKLHCCNICDKYFRDHTRLRMHSQTHGTDNIKSCEICGISYACPWQFKRHLLAHERSSYKPPKEPIAKSINLGTETDSVGEREEVRVLKSGRNVKITPSMYKDTSDSEDNETDEASSDEERRKAERSSWKNYVQKQTVSSNTSNHKNQKSFECQICGKKYDSNDKLKTHASFVHLDRVVHDCPECDKFFFNKNHLHNHADYHERVRTFTCLICAKKNTSAEALEEHSVQHREQKLHFCDVCDKYFKDNYALKMHSQSHTTEKVHVCKVCRRSYACPHSYKRHLLAHELGLIKKSSSSSKKTDEVIVETDEVQDSGHGSKDKLTDSLKKKCSQGKDNRNISFSSGKAVAPKCPFCSQRCNDWQLLKRHVMTLHQDRTIYDCPDCEKVFFGKIALRNHTDYHRKVKTFTCLVCSKKHSSAEELEKHSITHKNHKVYVCQVCDKHFRDKSLMRIHAESHELEKAHSCDVCGRQYACQQAFKKHLLTHGEETYQDVMKSDLNKKREKHIPSVVVYTGYSLKETVANKDKDELEDISDMEGSHTEPEAVETDQEDCDNEPDSKGKMTEAENMNPSDSDEEDVQNDVSQKNVPSNTRTPLKRKKSQRKHGKTTSFSSGKSVKPNCSLCAERCNDWKMLKRHVMTLHQDRTIYDCPDCEKVFFGKVHFKNHTDYHQMIKSFTCLVCSKKHSSTEELDKHSITHEHHKVYVCQVCDKHFRDKTGVRKHAESHELEKAHSCDVCGKKYACQQAFKKHLLTHGEETYQDAMKSASNKKRKKHMPSVVVYTGYSLKETVTNKDKDELEDISDMEGSHTETEAVETDQENCDNVPDSNEEMTEAENMNPSDSDEEDVQNDVSQKNVPSNIRTPLKRKCSQRKCGKNTHFSSGKADRSNCPFCAERCKDWQILKMHVMTLHQDRTIYDCQDCEKVFFGKVHFKNHTDYHRKVKTFTCLVCSKKHSSAEELEKHSITHGNHKVYVCQVCDKHFRDKTGMRIHVQSHKFEKAHSCDVCGRRYACQQAFKKHLLTHGKEKYQDVMKSTFSRKGKKHMSSVLEVKGYNFKETLTYKVEDDLEDISDMERSHANIEVISENNARKADDFTIEDTVVEADVHVEERVGADTAMEGPSPCTSNANVSQKGSFKCKVCKETFGSSELLDTHLKIHPGEKYSVCSDCGKSFPDKNRMLVHMRSHLGIKPYICWMCQMSFMGSKALDRHVAEHMNMKKNKLGEEIDIDMEMEELLNNEGDKLNETTDEITSRHLCCQCGKTFQTESDLQGHMRKKHTGETPYQCDFCYKSFHKEQSLQTHLTTHGEIKMYGCGICHKFFKHLIGLEHHVQSNCGKVKKEKKFKCEICNAHRSSAKSLQQHMAGHTGDLPYKCFLCGKAFSVKYHLDCHLMKHKGKTWFTCNVCKKGLNSRREYFRHLDTHKELRFVCKICRKRFAKERSLINHVTSHSRPPAERNIECGICHLVIATKHRFKNHMLTHANERNFECPHCQKRFVTKPILKQHLWTHTKKNAKMCDLCGGLFRDNTDLKFHKRTHTGETPYPCSLCSRAFITPSVLKKHMKSHDRWKRKLSQQEKEKKS